VSAAPAVEPPADQAPGTKPDAQQRKNKAEYHTVTKGETLYSIAKRNNITVDKLREMNGMSPENKLLVGKRLKVKQAEENR
jgi:LysM repeat protein